LTPFTVYHMATNLQRTCILCCSVLHNCNATKYIVFFVISVAFCCTRVDAMSDHLQMQFCEMQHKNVLHSPTKNRQK